MQHVDALSLLSAKQNVLQRMHSDRGVGGRVCVCAVRRCARSRMQLPKIDKRSLLGWEGGCNFRQDFARGALESVRFFEMVLFGVCVGVVVR